MSSKSVISLNEILRSKMKQFYSTMKFVLGCTSWMIRKRGVVGQCSIETSWGQRGSHAGLPWPWFLALPTTFFYYVAPGPQPASTKTIHHICACYVVFVILYTRCNFMQFFFPWLSTNNEYLLCFIISVQADNKAHFFLASKPALSCQNSLIMR